MNNRDMGKKSSTAVKMMADGGDVGFFERLRMGNIDQEGSRAYNELGAGKQAIDKAYSDTSRKMDVQPSEVAMPMPPKEDKVMPTEKDYGISGGSGMDESSDRSLAIEKLPSLAASERVTRVDPPAKKETPARTRPAAAPNTSFGAGLVNGKNAMDSAKARIAEQSAAPVLAKKPAPKSMLTDLPIASSANSPFNDNGSVKTDAPEPIRKHPRTGQAYANGGMVTYANGGMACNSRDMGK